MGVRILILSMKILNLRKVCNVHELTSTSATKFQENQGERERE